MNGHAPQNGGWGAPPPQHSYGGGGYGGGGGGGVRGSDGYGGWKDGKHMPAGRNMRMEKELFGEADDKATQVSDHSDVSSYYHELKTIFTFSPAYRNQFRQI